MLKIIQNNIHIFNLNKKAKNYFLTFYNPLNPLNPLNLLQFLHILIADFILIFHFSEYFFLGIAK